MQKLFCILILLLLYVCASAQIFPDKDYPKGYFIWPVAATKALAANFGELRPNHYHMGLDCKTDQKENIPVLAAANGYIAKIKIEPSGFGQAIYLNHPNGLTTLYAHLNSFYPALQRYIKEQQYKLKSWEIFIDIPPHMFEVEQGQQIALSGNTGGSQGPHLHFEIRDTKTDKVLNPLLFDFPIADNIPPDILRLAVYDRSISTYEQTPKIYPLKKVNGIYMPSMSTLILNTDKVSFAITAYDRYTGSTNQNGIYEAVLYDNNEAVIGFQMDSISYDETRYLNAHVDYKLRSSGGPFVQHLSRLPGYTYGIYKDVTGDGVINIGDENTHQIKIVVKDPNGNTSQVKFDVRSSLQYESKTSSAIYDPKEFHPGFINIFENDKIGFYMPENALYDSIRFKYKETPQADGSDIFLLHNGNIPVQCKFPIRIKNTTTSSPDKLVMHRWWGAKDDYAKAESVKFPDKGDWYQASFRAFGNVQLIEDHTPPAITPLGFRDGMDMSKLYTIRFVIIDNTEELENFHAEIDGQWVCFSNDKGKTFIYKFDEHCGPGEHELKISVEDCVGNRSERVYHFTR
ncbi:M23 family metallopeptidase [Ferruginibacter lapsinanis]|uniref:M23 family metallopeptidase n=1 Tax=Ferruginibacter lapsinanis TaxID=563172 RepID=UPI001E333CEC|nr:M23 family metallopeptidase [Ferruginibacter lapsinanis]UEG50979.1 M23 family metallopeptidase [Ferruginibacter lapsinanis]